jgi:thiamine kinase-like enzyme
MELPGSSELVRLTNELEPALDKIIERKIENFELEYNEGKGMNATIHNELNIINSEITNSVLQINQSGRDAISKETANKLEQLINSDEVKRSPEQTRLQVLDQVTDLIRELKGTPTDTGKVRRGLKRLAEFLRSVAASAMADMIAQAAIAYAGGSG